MPSQSYIGKWIADGDENIFLTILEIGDSTIQFKLGILRISDASGTAKIENNKIVFVTDIDLSGTMIFYDNGIKLVAEEDGIFAKGHIFDFAIKAGQQTTTAETPFTFADGTITGYNGTETAVVIPSQINGQAVTKIGEMAFYNKQLTSVTIPNSITIIESMAFCDNKFTNVTVPDSVTNIGASAFVFTPLTSVTIGANITLGSYVEAIGGRGDAFNEDLDSVYYSNGQRAGTYTLNNGVWSLSGNQQATQETAFEFEKGEISGYTGTATTLVIPSQIEGRAVTAIREYVFSNKQLTNVTIPDSVIYIGWAAFWDNPLISITIGANVEFGYEGDDLYAFDKEFITAYNNNGKQAGTYIINNGVWSME